MDQKSIRQVRQITAFRNYFQQSPDPVLAIGHDRDRVDLNPAMRHLLAASGLDSFKEKPTFKTVHALFKQTITEKDQAEKLASALKDGTEKNLETEISFHLNKMDVTYSVSVSPISGQDGKAVGKIAVFRNITEYVALLEAYKEQSIKDFLTNAYNQRFFYSCLYREIKRSDRYRNPFCLLMIDIDNLKAVNDTYGHLRGDMLLKELSAILKTNTREGIDYVARYGGDEFAIILINTFISSAKEVAERIIRNYHALRVKESSLSVGICQYRKDMSANNLIEKADQAMYEAKKSGGGKVGLTAMQ